MLDRVERLPIVVPLALSASAVVVPLAIMLSIGGTEGAVAVAVGVVVLVASAALLAWRVHIERLPLVLGPVAASAKLDGHTAFRFRALLGRGRAMLDARARVRFVSAQGDSIELEPIMARADQLLGPWTVVVIDREQVWDKDGRFEVEVAAVDPKGREWSVTQRYGATEVIDGRFSPGLVLRKGRMQWDLDAWSNVVEATSE